MIDLSGLNKKLTVRALRIEDYDALVTLELICFPRMKAWTKEQIESHLELFPEGQIVIVYQKRLIASSSSLIVNFDQYAEDCTWDELTDEGFIRNHDPRGNTLYGMEIMVHPEFRNLQLARRLYDARKKLAREKNLMRIIIGGRIPGYNKLKDQMSAHEYVDKVSKREIVDAVLTTQLSNGFVLKRVIPHYLDADMESRGYATLLEWENIEYKNRPVACDEENSAGE